MKILVSESQLRNLVKRHRKHMKDFDEAASLTSPSTSNQTTSSPSASSGGSSTTGDASGGTGAGTAIYEPERSPGVPQVPKWEDGVDRSGPGNQLKGDTTWSNIVGSKVSRNKYRLF